MKHSVLSSLMMGALLFGTASASFAQGTIQQRQENQQQRIGEGVENGSLTPRETTRLERQESALNKEVRHDRKTGGGLSPQERRQINRQQNRESRRIYRQKHDAQHQ